MKRSFDSGCASAQDDTDVSVILSGAQRSRRIFILSSAHHFTAPVMPSANCFCSTKNMMIVGSEQNRTPSISMP